MARLILLLLIAGAIVVFTLQNLSPIGLVFLGMRIQALPLAVWVVGALVAGGFTTLLLSGFFSLSKASVRRSAQRLATEKPRSPWSEATPQTGSASARTARTQKASDFRPAGTGNRRPADDWESNRSDDWDDWEDATPANQPPVSRARASAASAAVRTPINEPVDRQRPESGRAESRRAEPAPRRTDFEAPSTFTGQQSGSAYSYRRDSPDSGTVRKSNEVYDAEYRVLIPPFNAAAEPVVPPPTSPPSPASPTPPASPPSGADEEDWGLDDDLEEKPDRPR